MNYTKKNHILVSSICTPFCFLMLLSGQLLPFVLALVMIWYMPIFLDKFIIYKWN